MTTFRIPSLMVDSGLVAPPRCSGNPRHDYGDGIRVGDVFARCDGLFTALAYAGYHAQQIYVTPGLTAAPDTLTFPWLEHLDYSIGQLDWTATLGMPAPQTNATTIAVTVAERTRYDGVGPTFAVPLPSLSALGPISGTDGASCHVTVSTTTGLGGDTVITALRLELRVGPAAKWYDRMIALEAAAKTVVATIQSDLIVAAGTDWHLVDSGQPQAGLLPIFIQPAWRHSSPWALDEHSALIDAIGSEIFAALESAALSTGELLAAELFEVWSVGALLARVRQIPVPPSVAADLAAAWIGRLAVVSGSKYPPLGGPLDAIHDRSYGRMLMLAHELRIIDVLGSSSAAAADADVAAVQPLRLDLGITGYYESRWDSWESDRNEAATPSGTNAQIGTSEIRDMNADWVGCLQINQVGQAINGWWQTRNYRGARSEPITTAQRRFVAEIHDDADPQRPVLRFAFDGATWAGLMKFDFRPSATWTLNVLFGAVSTGSNSVPEIIVPPEMCTRRDYLQVHTRPHLHAAAIDSLAAPTRALVRALDRYPLHELERRNVDAAAERLRQNVQAWLLTPPGGTKSGIAMQADQHIAAAFAKYLHPDDRPHVLVAMKQRLRARLYAGAVEVDGGRYSAYNQTVNMVNQQITQTPTIADLLDLQPQVVDGDNAYIYDWELATIGVAGDVLGGGGGFTGNMLITKRHAGTRQWSQSYAVALVEGGGGLSGGATFTKITTGTIVSNADWEAEDFAGSFDMEGAESGLILARWGWGGQITFHGDGSNAPLSGSAGGLNWALGPSAAILDVSVAAGVLAFGAPVVPPTIDPATLAAYSTQHATLEPFVESAEAFFAVGSSVVRPAFATRLEQLCCDHLAAFMSPHGQLIIAGHTSAPAGEDFNLELSWRRARAITESLRALLGDRLLVPEERTIVRGWGERDAPGGPDGPEVQRARRVDVLLDAELMVAY